MKRRFAVLPIFLVLILMLVSGCAPGGTSIEPSGPAEPAPEQPIPEEPAQQTNFSNEIPAFQIPPVEKPSLTISDEQAILQGIGFSGAHTIGFVFPDGLVAMKATAVNNPEGDNLTIVGIVEIGSGAEKIASGTYLVAIDLTSSEAEVPGMLLSWTQDNPDQELTFSQTPLERNPEREDSPSFPSINPIISSSAVCFVIGATYPYSGEVSQTSGGAQFWSRYCSLASTSGETILSVRDNFPSQFRELTNRLEQSIAHLADQGFAHNVNIDLGLTISEMEGHSNINACNENKDCAADLTGAPNMSFWEDYAQALDGSAGEPFAVTAGLVRIERPLNTPGQVKAADPGDYWVRLWFDPQETFIGATIFGVTDENVPILGETIPAIPGYFFDAEDPRAISAWISGWRLCKWCAWQSNCP